MVYFFAGQMKFCTTCQMIGLKRMRRVQQQRLKLSHPTRKPCLIESPLLVIHQLYGLMDYSPGVKLTGRAVPVSLSSA